MANAIVRLPVGYFPDPDIGRPLWNAKIYVGVVDLDPKIPANQITVTGRQESGAEVTLPQPVRTNSGGVPVDTNGDVVTLLVDGAYSMRVDDRQDNDKYYFANVLEGAPVVFTDLPNYSRIPFNTVQDAKSGVLNNGDSINLQIGDFVVTNGYNSVNDGGGANYVVVANGTGTDDGGSYHDMANGSQLKLIINSLVNVKQFGAIGDGTTDDLVAFTNAGSIADSVEVEVSSGNYLLSSQPNPTATRTTWIIQRGASFVNPNSLAPGDSQKIVSTGDYDSIEGDPNYHEGIFTYLETNSAETGYGNLGLHGSVNSSQKTGAATAGAVIGVSGFAANDKLDHSGGAWALYGTAVREDGVTGPAFGLELDIANLGSTVQLFPFDPFSAGQNQTLWLGSGGEISETADAPSLGTASAAIGIISNDPAFQADFDKGIVFHSEAISGTDGLTGLGIAIAMATRHSHAWFNGDNTKVAEITSTNTAATNRQRLDFGPSGLVVTDIADASTQFQVENVAGAANRITIRSSVTTETPSVVATGSDIDIDIRLKTKGAGVFQLGYLSTAAITPANFSADRIIEVKDDSGTPYYIPAMATTW